MKQLRQEPEVVAASVVRSPTLHDLLRVSGSVDWRAVADRIKSHGYEAGMSGMYGWYGGRSRYPLQLALTRPSDPAPPEVIRSLIDAHPDAAFTCDEIGNTPLYYECIHGNSPNGDILRMLLDANPSAASQPERYYAKIPLHVARDERTARLLLAVHPGGITARCHLGQLPIHRACLNRDASPGLCRLLVKEGRRHGLEDGGGVFFRDVSGKTPLDYVCDKIIHGSDWRRDGSNGMGSGSSCSAGSTNLERFWEKLSTLACGVLPPMHCRSPSDDSLLVLHAVVELGCSPELVGIALRMLPSQTRELDRLGRSPLAIAASKGDVSPVIVDLLLNSEHGCTEVAAVVDERGRLPLHHAARSGRDFDGVMWSILKAEPVALMTRDGDGLFPFMAAAAGAKSTSVVDTVYLLLKEAPTVLSDCLLTKRTE